MLHEPLHRIAEGGSTLVDPAGRPLPTEDGASLTLDGRGLRVEDGSADLYLDRPGRAGRRRRLLTLGAGEIAFPVVSRDRSLGLVAFPARGATVSTFEPDSFLARLDAGDEEAIAGIETWIERIDRVVAVPLPGVPSLLGEGAGQLAPGVVARPSEGVVWIDVLEGVVATDMPGSGPRTAHDLPVPVASGGLASERGARIHGRSGADLAAEHGLARAVLGFQSALAGELAVAIAAADANETVFVAGKTTRDRTILAGTVEPVVTRHARGEPHGNTLTAAFLAVAEAGGATLPTVAPIVTESNSAETQIADLAAWAGLRPRRVQLGQDWWRKGGQSILGFRREDGAAVALVAGSGWRSGYRRWQGGRALRVDARGARDLLDHGYLLQRRLPDGPVDGRGLLRFAQPLALGFLLAILVVGLLGSALSLVTPMATEILFETVIPAASRPELVQLAGGIAALGLGRIVFDLVRGFLVLRLATILNADLEGAVWDRLLRLPTSFFKGFSAGDLALRAAAINQMRDAVSGTVINSLLSAIFSLSSLGLILYYDWRLALVAIGLVVVQLVVMVAVNLRVIAWKRRALEAEGRLQALALQLIQGIAKLKVAGAEARGFARWSPLFIERRGLELRQHGISAGFSAFASAFGIASTAIMIGIVGLGGIEIGIGRFIAFNAAYGQFMAATLSLGGALPALLSLGPLYERAEPLLKATPENAGRRGAVRDLRGGIEVSNLTFRYQADGPAILDGISMVVRPGEFVGIVGMSGCGKSTLVRLLLGFETPASGSIFFDNLDFSSLDLRSVRRQMGVVLQSSRATTGTLMDNILNGAALTEAEAWEAARIAGLDADIRAMPMRMHTYVGEDGALLSGGQRQRLLIARAVVRSPRILLFDEATSALDNRTQQIVSEGLERLAATRVVIAHRLSTIQNADRIYLLDAGRIAETGTYGELLAANGLFADLVRRQIV